MSRKKSKMAKKILGVASCGVVLVVGGLVVADMVASKEVVVKADGEKQSHISTKKKDEGRQSKRFFQKSEEKIDNFYSGVFNLPLQPIVNDEFTGGVTEVYEKLKPFAQKYSDPKWSTIPEAKYDYTFSTVAKANTFLGFDKILHPLENEEKVCVEIFGGNTGFIHVAYINTEYRLDGKKVKIANIIPTEYSQYPTGDLASCGHTEMFSHLISLYAGKDTTDEYTIEIYSDKDFSYKQSFYSFEDLDVTLFKIKQDDSVTVEAYFVIDGILYVAGIEVSEEQVLDANATLKEIVKIYAESGEKV